MKVFLRVLGVIAACVGIYFSVTMIDASQKTEIPEKYVYVSSLSNAYRSDWSENMGAQYLGGDAYNYIVEASLKAGYYNATVTTKTVKEVGGFTLLFGSIFFLLFSLYSLNSSGQKSHSDTVDTNDEDYHSYVLQHLQHIEESLVPPIDQTDKYTNENVNESSEMTDEDTAY